MACWSWNHAVGNEVDGRTNQRQKVKISKSRQAGETGSEEGEGHKNNQGSTNGILSK